MLNSFITIELKTLDKTILNIYIKFIKRVFSILKISSRFVSLPNTSRKFTLLKSPHVYKKAREQFEFNAYKQIIKILNTNKIYFLKYLVLNKPTELKLTIKKNF